MGYTEKDGRLFDAVTGADMGPAKPAFLPSEVQELNNCRKVAGSWVLSLLDDQIKSLQSRLDDNERIGYAFRIEQIRIYLAALKTAREGAKKALDASSQTVPHTCGSGGSSNR